MPVFTIETTYRLPVDRQRSYEAETLDAACALAIADEGWDDENPTSRLPATPMSPAPGTGATPPIAAGRSASRRSSANRSSAEPTTSRCCSACSRSSRRRRTLDRLMVRSGASAWTRPSPGPRRSSPVEPDPETMEARHDRVRREGRLRRRAFDSVTFEADADAERSRRPRSLRRRRWPRPLIPSTSSSTSDARASSPSSTGLGWTAADPLSRMSRSTTIASIGQRALSRP